MKLVRIFPIIIPFLLLSACDRDECNPVVYDTFAPLPPVGIISISLDNAVELQWIENQEPDIAGYNIYVSNSYNGRYDRIGTTPTASFIDRGARNGVTYYYAVTAFDFSGNESALSRDVVYDTPRPEGRSVALVDRYRDPFRSGYDFSDFRILHFDTEQTDFFFEITGNGVPYLVVWNDSDIQDMGYTKNLDEISAAPESGWSPTKDAHAILGHTYVIWTYNNHFAKVRITDITPTSLRFDWAYQVAKGNPELFHPDRPQLTKRNRVRPNIPTPIR